MKPISFQDFDRIYQRSVATVFQHWTYEMQAEIATHCHGWAPGAYDFENYLIASAPRFYRAYRSVAGVGAGAGDKTRICDVGGFWGVFPITLKQLGFDVAMTESLQYYGDSFNGLVECIADNGISIHDYDPFKPDSSLSARFDALTVLAVLEHYPHSLKPFMHNVISMLEPKGRLYIEVPNIAYWPKRVGLMRGQTPHAQLEDIYKSDVPFIGHHHEFTISELRDLARLSGLSILEESFYNYTPGALRSLKMLIRSPVQFLAFTALKESRECIAVLCEVANGEGVQGR